MEEKYGLNEEQWRAIDNPSKIVICNASAGSGKTRTLVAKIRYLLDNDVSPKSILSITFSNKAANEMKERIKSFYPDLKEMQISTIHSMSVKIINKFIQHTPLKSPFSIYDDSNQLSIIKTLIKARNLTEDPYELLSNISRVKSGHQNDLKGDIASILKAYQEILIKNNAADFDDLLIYAEQCLQQPDCHQYYSNLWQHILVDEFQDTSVIQYKIITRIYTTGISKTFFAAADQNQSIYGWRGARPENMNDFIKKYNPSICHLTYNYRSGSEIIDHANNFLQYGPPMVPKTTTPGMVSFTQFQSQEEEAEKIAGAILKMQNYEETAILFRVNARTLLFERTFTQRRIPYKIVGALPFYKRKVVKDLLCYCKASLNPEDIESLVRVVNVPKRGFGETRQERLLLEGRPYLDKSVEEVPRIKSFIDLLEEIKNKSPLEAINTVLHQTDYRRTLTTDNDRFMVDSFLDVVSGFNSIEDLILASNFIEKDSGHGVKLMSAHASKGLEFDRVFVVGVEDGLWPHNLSENIEEESRLYYVSITRSKKWLNVSYSKSRICRGKKIDVLPSSLFIDSYKSFKK